MFVGLPSRLLHVAFTKHLCLIHCSASSDFIDFRTWTFLSSYAEASTTAAILGAVVSYFHVYCIYIAYEYISIGKVTCLCKCWTEL